MLKGEFELAPRESRIRISSRALALAGRHVSVQAFSTRRDLGMSLSERMDVIRRERESMEQ